MSLKRKAVDVAVDAAKKPKQDGSITAFFGAPKVKPSPNAAAGAATFVSTADPTAAATATIKFDKSAWVEKLSDEHKDLLKLEINTMHESWLGVLKDEILKPDFLSLKRFLKAENASGKKVFPPPEDIYSWSRHTPLTNVKAVIIGQDPYHNVNQAHGLCFSVKPPTPAPPSLKRVYAALKNDYPDFTPPPNNGGLLTPWADSGVLLLNTCLTVRAHEANSHSKKGWETFTQKVIDIVDKRRTKGVVFLAWGKPAQARCAKVNSTRHLVLKAIHPSPLAQGDFTHIGHFKKANEWLTSRYGEEGRIDWNLNKPPKETDTLPIVH